MIDLLEMTEDAAGRSARKVWRGKDEGLLT
jgi:hypothetical protein